MVEIYLNPENETNWDDLELDKRQELPEPLRAAEKLLHELPRSPRQQARAAAPRPACGHTCLRALPAATPRPPSRLRLTPDCRGRRPAPWPCAAASVLVTLGP